MLRKPMTHICRSVIRIALNPDNKWAWYELAKKGYTLEQALWIARQRRWNEDVVRKGYEEYDINPNRS